MNKIGISTDCMCDLPTDYVEENNIDVMQFYIHTATGRFWSEKEITSDNIVEYLEAGNVVLRFNVPEVEECKVYFEELLTRYDEVIHITASDKVGLSYPNAKAALELMGKNADRVILINSGGISTGLGHMVQLAVRLRDSERSVEEITKACNELRNKISNSFILPNADYLYRIGHVSLGLKNLCNFLGLHPIICTKDGKLAIKAFRIGNYNKAVKRYVHSEFKHSEKIAKRQLFITHAGCAAKMIAQVKAEVDGLCKFDRVTVTKTSAVISSCCGPEAVGVMFVYR